MAYYDRDYYRREGPSYIGAWANTGQVCKWLVVTNVLIYLVQLLTVRNNGNHGPFTAALEMDSEKVFHQFQIWRLVTGAFLHDPANMWHLIWNMLFLWFFGRDVEDLYGKHEFLTFYITAGVLGNAFWGMTALWQYPGEGTQALGASGAVMAVVVLCACHYPYRTMLLMFVIPTPYWLFALILVGLDLHQFLRAGGTSMGVAVAAHLAGAAFGFFYYKLEWRLLEAWSNFVARMRRSNVSRPRLYREPTTANVSSSPARQESLPDEQLEAKTDAILEKVSQQGLDSLTPEEKAILQRASEQYKRRKT